ncbi:MAG TPA: hypothetical protein VEJ23_01105, partial [Solirubrobacteraceae bacterium]|nr:hypothetical protein [Solirubrobacteraceae bacterium]
ATAEGLRWRGLSRLGVYRVGPGGFEHACELATVALALQRRFPSWRVMSERELRVEEAEAERLIASIALGELPGGRRALHCPDLVLIGQGRIVAVEIELSVKAPRRLAAICPRLGACPLYGRRLLPGDVGGGEGAAARRQ